MTAPEAVIDPVLLEILRCPHTKQPLRIATPAELESLNRRIEAGECLDAADELVKEPAAGGLVSQDEQWLYAIRDAIPTLIPGEAIALRKLGETS